MRQGDGTRTLCSLTASLRPALWTRGRPGQARPWFDTHPVRVEYFLARLQKPTSLNFVLR